MEKKLINKNIQSINIELLQSGQVGSYKDTIYKYKIITSYKTYNLDKWIEDFCTKVLRPSSNKGSDFSGSCNFPFGLNRYYSFNKSEDGSYNYYTCDPYTG